MNKQDLSISMTKAGIYSLMISIPLGGIFALFFIARWGNEQFQNGFDLLFRNFFYFLFVFAIGVIVHEFIHGITWMYFGKKPLKAIQFGFQVKTFTPFAHCKEPLSVNAYRIGTLMPGVLLGLLPALIGIANGNAWLLAFGILFITAAGGDFLILWLIRNVSTDKLVEDHPTQAGCYVFDIEK